MELMYEIQLYRPLLHGIYNVCGAHIYDNIPTE